jgi:hypothetical protein
MHRCHLMLALARGLLYDAAANDPVLQVRPACLSRRSPAHGGSSPREEQQRPLTPPVMSLLTGGEPCEWTDRAVRVRLKGVDDDRAFAQALLMSLVPSTLWQGVVDASATHMLTGATCQPLVAWCVAQRASRWSWQR